MSYTKKGLLEKTIQIVTAYASSEGSNSLDVVLGQVYDKLVELNEKA